MYLAASDIWVLHCMNNMFAGYGSKTQCKTSNVKYMLICIVEFSNIPVKWSPYETLFDVWRVAQHPYTGRNRMLIQTLKFDISQHFHFIPFQIHKGHGNEIHRICCWFFLLLLSSSRQLQTCKSDYYSCVIFLLSCTPYVRTHQICL